MCFTTKGEHVKGRKQIFIKYLHFLFDRKAPAGAGVNGRCWKVRKVENPVFNFSTFQCRTEGDSPPSPPPNLSKEFLKAIAPRMQVVSVGKCVKLETLFSTFPLFNAG